MSSLRTGEAHVGGWALNARVEEGWQGPSWEARTEVGGMVQAGEAWGCSGGSESGRNGALQAPKESASVRATEMVGQGESRSQEAEGPLGSS